MGHVMGALLPNNDHATGRRQTPKCSEIYAYDPDIERRALQRSGIFDRLNEVALIDLEATMQEFNPFAREFISVGNRMQHLNVSEEGDHAAA
jgi:hypothetical protein